MRAYFPVYGHTPQLLAQELLVRKVLASEQVDGMDVEAAGAGTRETIDTLELGQAIYQMLISQHERELRAT